MVHFESFERAELRVRRCLEPLHTGHSVEHVPSFSIVPDATREALVGIPAAIVWELEHTR